MIDREAGSRKARFLAEGLSLALLAFCLFLLLTNILPTRRHLALLKRDRVLLREEIRLQEAERARLDKYAEALDSDPYMQERAFKRTFRIYRPGEKVLR